MSKGLRQQIADGDNKITYKPLSPQALSSAMTEIFVKPLHRDNLAVMLKERQVTQQEYDSLLKMINSPDNENLTVAESLMQLKKPNQDGNTIYSREP